MKFIVFFLLLVSVGANAQSIDLSVLAYKGRDSSKPLLFYISGDGGLSNSFSTAFMQQFQNQGYSIVGMNAKSYFWTRKTPQQAASDIGRTITAYLQKWNCKAFVLIGYSFGADVAPFIERCFPPTLAGRVRHIVLMSPSEKTDFEIHVLNMLGLDINKGVSVPDEINQLTIPVTLIFGKDETGFPFSAIAAKHATIIKVSGGHHYNRDVNELRRQIMNAIK